MNECLTVAISDVLKIDICVNANQMAVCSTV